jgi:hypothetical protein
MKIFNLHSILCSGRASKHRRRMRKRALSSVLSTVILVSVMLTVAIMVIGFASNLFAVQSDSVEYSQAQNTMINYAGIIEQISAKQGSSGYVLFNPRSGGPIFLSNVGTINVTLSCGTTNFTLINGSYNTLKYMGGILASTIGKNYLRGAAGIITYNNNSTLGSVYTEQVNGSWVVLDYARIGVLNLGIFNFSKGIVNGTQTFEMVNLIQVQYLNITKGSYSGGGSLNAVATCKNIYVNYNRTQDPNPPSNYSLTVTMRLAPTGKPVNSSSLPISIPNNYDTIVMVVRSDVEISMFGG